MLTIRLRNGLWPGLLHYRKALEVALGPACIHTIATYYRPSGGSVGVHISCRLWYRETSDCHFSLIVPQPMSAALLKVTTLCMQLLVVLDEGVIFLAVCLDSLKGFFAGFCSKGLDEFWKAGTVSLGFEHWRIEPKHTVFMGDRAAAFQDSCLSFVQDRVGGVIRIGYYHGSLYCGSAKSKSSK